MKQLEPFAFSVSQCEVELAEFKALLTSRRSLKEHGDILPFFRHRNHLAAFIGKYAPRIFAHDNRVLVDSNPIICLSYDELQQELDLAIRAYRLDYGAEKQE